MKISEMSVGQTAYTQLGRRVLAVLVRRTEGSWSVYVDAVPGKRHDDEWQEVRRTGDKQGEVFARAIATSLFDLEIDLPYAK